MPLALYAMLAPLLGKRIAQPKWVESGYHATNGLAALFGLASIILISAFLNDDFAIAYVFEHSNRSLPLFYKIAGLWAGLDGSLLFWVLLLAIMTVIALRRVRASAPVQFPVVNAVLNLIMLFFAVMLIFPNNPFTLLIDTPPDGMGLNPLLQNPYMVIHPPSLYIGYVSAAIPFALGIGAVVAHDDGIEWLKRVRPWIYLCWFFLTLGNLLGMNWAYVELGWGGFWAWDPVENAAVMPWFTATAFIHSTLIQERRGMFKIWNVSLLTLTCLLTIFGTYLTRSGVVQSVHAFAGSTLGPYFLTLLATILVIGLLTILTHLKELRTRSPITSIWTKEGMFLLNNVLMVVSSFAIIWGTMLPTFSEMFTDQRVTVGPPYFNRMMAPIGVAILVFLGIGPVTSWAKQDLVPLLQKIWWAFAIAVLTGGVTYALGLQDPYMSSAIIVVTFSLLLTLREFVLGSNGIIAKQNCSRLQALLILLQRYYRQYGGFVVHIGVLILFIGFAGAAYQTERIVNLSKNESAMYKGYEITFKGLEYSRDDHKEMMDARVEVKHSGKVLATLTPSHYLYRSAEQPSTEVDIYRSLLEDVYLILGGFDYDNQKAELKIMINPLVNIVWVGGIIMLLGSIWIIWPRKRDGGIE
jgi:cytochrome c-type biogenesis protein CcmF